jgi:hypothetical protein
MVHLHACSDTSIDIAREALYETTFRLPLERIELSGEDADSATWDEMAHRQLLLRRARARGATHIVIMDADELLTGNLLPTIRQRIEQIPPGWIFQLPGYNLRNSLSSFHANGTWGNRIFSAGFADHPCFKWEGDRFHHREPMGLSTDRAIQICNQGQGGILHFWGASERRLKAKVLQYKITERLRWPDKPVEEILAEGYNWALDGRPGTDDVPEKWQYAVTPPEWWVPYAELMKYLDVDKQPWQEKWNEEMIALHGLERFRGLL